MTIIIDPMPGAYPHCVCDQHPEIACEFPCWQQFGLNEDFDPKDENSCCCKRQAERMGLEPIKPKTQEEIAQERVTFEKWLGEKTKERADAAPTH